MRAWSRTDCCRVPGGPKQHQFLVYLFHCLYAWYLKRRDATSECGLSHVPGLEQRVSVANTVDFRMLGMDAGGAEATGGGAGGLFGNNNGMEASFKEFCALPENQKLMEAQQRKEARQAAKAQLRMKTLEFRQKVLEADYESQQNIAPYLENPVLRRIIQTFTNDPKGDFDKWAKNPEVLGMLRHCKQMMEQGYLSADEMETTMIKHLQNPTTAGSEKFRLATKQVARLPTEHLVGALNEHLTERRQGNDFYRAKDLVKAMHHYERARAVVDFVEGLSKADQEEVDRNKVAIYLNIAAVRISTAEYRAAADFCTKALELEPKNIKALLRRAKAHIGRREYQAAFDDLQSVKTLDTWNAEADDQEQRLKRMMHSDKDVERLVYNQMFDRDSSHAQKQL